MELQEDDTHLHSPEIAEVDRWVRARLSKKFGQLGYDNARRRSRLRLRTAARIRFERHMYKERFGHLGHDNARRRGRLRLRAAVERLPASGSDDICTRNYSAIYVTATPEDAADCVSQRPFALGSDDICTKKATCPGAAFPSRACF